ncbi:hypothetical protein D3C72_2392390 [compost metagenome]
MPPMPMAVRSVASQWENGPDWPNAVMLVSVSEGLTLFRSANPRPRRVITPGCSLSMTRVA